MSMEKQWLAVYTKPRWEKKVAKLLDQIEVENYCPLNRVVRQWSDRKKIVWEPLFPSYVFVYTTINNYIKIKETDGVLNFVYWLGKPAVIRSQEIQALKAFLDDHEDVSLEKIDVNVDDEVRIIHGPLIAMEGKVIDVQSNHVKILLPSLGYSVAAKLPKTHVEVMVHRVQLSSNNNLSKVSSL